MLKYIITSPSSQITSEIKEELQKQKLEYFDAQTAKQARNENDSKKLNLTRYKPTENPDKLTTQCCVIAGYHDPQQVLDELNNNSIIIAEPESVRIIADLFKNIAFDVIIPHELNNEPDDEFRFKALTKLEDNIFPENITGTLITPMCESNTPENLINYLQKRWVQYDNVTQITKRFIKLGLLTQYDDGTLPIYTKDNNNEQNEPIIMSMDSFVTLQLDDEDKLNDLLCLWTSSDKLKYNNNCKKPKFIILGRTGTGKNHLAQILQQLYKDVHKEELNILKSVTTRPQRDYNDTNYHFLTQEQADNIPAEHKTLTTHIGEYEYFARKEDFEKSDILILDPNGLKEIIETYPDQPLFVCQIKTNTKLTNKQLAQRSSNISEERQRYETRYQAENEMFTKFEHDFDVFPDIYDAPKGTLTTEITNNFSEETIIGYAITLIQAYQAFLNLQTLYPLMGTATNLPLPDNEQINDGVAKLLTNEDNITDFLIAATMTLTNIPFDEMET